MSNMPLWRERGIMGIVLRAGGILVILAGVYIIYRSNNAYPEPSEPLWWTGLVVLVIGLHMFFFSNMAKHQIYEWLKSETIALGLALLIRWPIAEPYRIPSSSMEPTLHGDNRFGRGDRVFVNKWIYGVRFPFLNKRIWYGKKPERWEIVVFQTVEKNARHKTLVKRIVGLPGEKVHIAGGKIYINGKPLELPPDMPKIYYTSVTGGLEEMKFGIREEDEYSLIPENHYFVLGDNSSFSRDGRFFGWVPNEHIVGRVSCIWWPPSRWRDFTGFSKTWWWKTLCTLLAILLGIRLLVGRSVVWYRWNSNKLSHYFVSFLEYGLRVPFTKIWITKWKHPSRGDVVSYFVPDNIDGVPNGTIACGIVAGIEGDKVQIQNGKLIVNNEEFSHPLLSKSTLSPNYTIKEASYGYAKDKGHSTVPPGSIFVVWSVDESNELKIDSRTYGWIKVENIFGKVKAVWWPPKDWKRFS
ncbi:MAG: signal peptidase I [Candidatus Hydrogenedentes bacterium]|nr:signal peptidase I [Candidatus Hydrogenedentota bacterium]